MDLIDRLAEQRVSEAVERGELDDLPGAGRPLALEDDTMIPEHLRTAYRVLKNAGCVPPELAARQEIRSLEDLIDALHEDASSEAAEQRRHAERRLAVLRAHLEERGGGRGEGLQAGYRDRLLRRLGG